MTGLQDPTAPALTSPLASAIDADLLTALQGAPATVAVIPHVDGLQVATDSGWVAEEDLETPARLWDRDGAAVGAPEFRIDYGSAAGAALLAGSLIAELLQDLAFGGVYLAGLVSGRGEPGYDPPDPVLEGRGHFAHGGSYQTRGVRSAIEQIRALVDGVPDLVSEAVREHLADAVDLTAEGSGWLPGHPELAEEDLLALGVSDVADEARHMAPPLWSIVHNETSQSGRLVQPFTRAPRSDSHHHPYMGWTGLSDAEWNQLLAYQVATLVVQGHLPMLQMPLDHWNDRIDPDAADPKCVRFARRAFAALRDTDWAARFLSGRSELPLAHTAARETTVNPFSWVRKISPRIVEQVGPPDLPVYNPGGGWSDGWSDGWSRGAPTPTDGAGAAHVDFDVPTVLASMWRAPGSTDLGLVLVNWTASSAAWQGVFRPRRYTGWGSGMFTDGWSDGWARGPAYRIDHLRSSFPAWSDGWSDGWGGTAGEEQIAAGLHAPISVECSGTAGTRSGQTIYLGAMPPYSIHVYRFRQE